MMRRVKASREHSALLYNIGLNPSTDDPAQVKWAEGVTGTVINTVEHPVYLGTYILTVDFGDGVVEVWDRYVEEVFSHD